MKLTLSGLSLRDLEYAVTVARTLHFGQAADLCGVSQPALSEQLRKLEALLGVTLFERSRRGVRVTEQGAILLHQAEILLSQAHDLLELAHTTTEPLARTLRLAAIHTLGPYYLPHLLRQTRSAYPKLAWRLEEGQTEPLLQALRSGTLDLVLAALDLPEEGLTTTPLFYEPFILVCPAQHSLAHQPHITLADLATEGLLLLEEGHCLRDQTLSLCQTAPPQTRMATSLETLWHMVLAGEGFSLMPALSLAGRTGLNELVTCRPLPAPQPGRTIALAWRKTDPRAPAYAALATLLAANPPAPLFSLPPAGNHEKPARTAK